MQRRHRWIRGDWQIANWILPVISGTDNRLLKNPLSLLSKWKIADNLRRSFVPLSLLLLFLFGWIISTSPFFWTITVLTIILLSAMLNFVWQLMRKPPDVIFVQHFINITRLYVSPHLFHIAHRNDPPGVLVLLLYDESAGS